MAAQIDNLLTQFGGYGPKQLQGALTTLQKGRMAAEKPLIKSLNRTEARIEQIFSKPLPKPPGEPNLAPIPQAPVEQFHNPVKAFGDAATTLAIFGSLLTREPLTSALNAAAGAMTAYHKGDIQRVHLEHQKWLDSMQTALHQNAQELQRYQMVLDSTKLTMAERAAELEGIAAENKDEQMKAALATGNWDALEKILEARQKTAGTLAALYIKAHKETALMQKYDAIKAANPGLSDQEAMNIATGVVRPLLNPLSGQSSMVDLAKHTQTPLEVTGGHSATDGHSATGGHSATPPNAPNPILGNLSGYGAKPWLEDLSTRTLGQLPFMKEFAFPDTVQTREKYRVLREMMIQAFKRPGRTSAFAQKRVEELLPSLGASSSPIAAYGKLSEAYKLMEENMQQDQGLVDDPNTPKQTRVAAANRIFYAKRAMEMIGNPADFPAPGSESRTSGALGTKENPIVDPTQKQIDDADAGTYFEIPGHGLMQKHTK